MTIVAFMRRRVTRRGAGALPGIFLLASLGLGACSDSGSSNGEGSGLRVVTTTVQIGALAREVGGDQITLTTLLQPGVDPHDFEPTPSDLKSIKNANVILANGLGLDDFLQKATKGAGGGKNVVTISDGVTVRGQGEKTGVDPHIWHNPENVKRMVENIAEAFASRDAGNAATYRQRATAYAVTLDETDRQIAGIIASIPPANRKMVTDHDAFGYFIEHYGLTYVGAVIPGVSTQGEPSAKEIASLTDLIKREGVRAIFAEGSVDPKVAREIAKDTGVRIVEDLYGDSLGVPGSGAETVHGMLLANAKKIAEALKW